MTWRPPQRVTAQQQTQSSSFGPHVMGAVSIGVVAALWLYVIRAPLSRSLAAGVVFAIGSFVLFRATETPRLDWPTAAHRPQRFSSTPRWRLNGFDALTDRKPGLSPDLRRRLAGLATAEVLRRHLEPGSPAAVALIGSGNHDLLFPPELVEGEPKPPDPTRDELTELIDRLIELGSAPPPEGSS